MKNLKALRKAAHLNQGQLAEKLGVKRSTLCMWETGKNTPPTKYILPLARILGCTVEALLKDEGVKHDGEEDETPGGPDQRSPGLRQEEQEGPGAAAGSQRTDGARRADGLQDGTAEGPGNGKEGSVMAGIGALAVMCGGLLLEVGIGIAAVVALLTEDDTPENSED